MLLSGRKKLISGVVALILLVGIVPAAAQEATPEATPALTPMRVEIPAADGLTLVGDLYNAELNVQTPAVLLMHVIGGKRSDWLPLIPTLMSHGYRVVTVDLRGFGETKGAIDWTAAVGDVQTWLDWMHSQPSIDPARIGIIGGSMGANLALVGCANDAKCVTAIAISPGVNYFGIGTGHALSTGYRTRSAFLIASQNDQPSGSDVKTMITLAQGEVGLHLYPGAQHGTNLLTIQHDSIIPLIVNWLDIHLQLN